MPPAGKVPCIACPNLYPTRSVGIGLLGSAPHKYCYRVKCQEKGTAAGHIKSNKRAASSVAGGGGSSSPEPMVMARELTRADIFGPAKLYEVDAVYGFRHGHATLPAPPAHLHLTT